MSLEFKHLLAQDAQLPSALRDAIASGQIRRAGEMLMLDFGLDCAEAMLLLDESPCAQRASSAR